MGNICGSNWLHENEECNKCAPSYTLINQNCILKCGFGETRQKDYKCTAPWYVVTLKYVGYVGATLSALALMYKISIFIRLKRSGKLRKDLGFVRGFIAVIAYSGKGDHVVNNEGNIDNNRVPLLSEDCDKDKNLLEMSARSSFAEFLDTAGLRDYETNFVKYGIKSTKDLDGIVPEDLEDVGLSRFEQRKFRNSKQKRDRLSKEDITVGNVTLTDEDPSMEEGYTITYE